MIEGEVRPSQKDLLPGGLSMGGFLTEGQTLNGVICRDNETLSILGYSKDELAGLLNQELNNIGTDSHPRNYTAPNGKTYSVRAISYRGWQDCPWQDVPFAPGSSVDYFFDSNEQERISAGMMPHLIKEHNFFEGGNYRIAPEDIVEMFGEEKIPGSIQSARRLQLA